MNKYKTSVNAFLRITV